MALLVGEIFRRNAAVVPGRPAASMGDRTLTYAELNREANRLAHALRELGVGHGDHVVSWTDTSLDPLRLFAACAKLGAVFAPVNARLGEREAGEVVEFARARILVTDAAHAEAAEGVARSVGVPLLGRIGAPAGPGVDLDDAAARASAGEPKTPELRERDTHVIFFTSGSTGRSKGVVLSHRVHVLRVMQGGTPVRNVCMFPLFHMAGYMNAMGSWYARGEITFAESAAPEVLLAEVERRRPERLYCIPAVWSRILDCDLGRYDLSSLEGVDTGTSATPPELIEALKERFPGTTTQIIYGSTECSPAVTLGDEDVLRKPGSVGLPARGVEAKLGDAGELCLRSDFLMDGYFENPEATAEALRDGWYHTGDVAEFDDEGYISIVGRVRDIIRTGGETVAPTEVERALAGFPGVADLAVVGVPDPQWGEVVCAVVVPEPGARVQLEPLREHAAARLAQYKQPRRLELIDSLPRTPATGQIQRTRIVQQIEMREKQSGS